MRIKKRILREIATENAETPGFDLTKELFNEKLFINESVIQEAVKEEGGIEFSYTGELIPVEIVEGKIGDFLKALEQEINKENKEDELSPRKLHEIIIKIAGEKFK